AFASHSVGRRLLAMSGVAAGAAVLLGVLALFGLGAGAGGPGNGLLLAMSVIALAVAGLAGATIHFVRNDLVGPLHEVCAAMRELAEGNREVHVPHEVRADEIGEIARYLIVIKKAANKFDRIRRERDEATAEELRRLTELESEREELRARQ